MKDTTTQGQRARPTKSVTRPHEKRNEQNREAGGPQTKRTSAKEKPPAVTSGSRPTDRRARGNTPQTKPAMTPKQTISYIAKQTKVAQTDVTNVFRTALDICGRELITAGMFTFPEIGLRVKRQPVPQTGRAREGFVLTAVPLSRLLAFSRAKRAVLAS